MNEDDKMLVDLLTKEEQIANMQEILGMTERDIRRENQRHMEALEALLDEA